MPGNKLPRFECVLSEQHMIALRRLATADERSASATVRFMIRTEAARRGLWPAATGDRKTLKAV